MLTPNDIAALAFIIIFGLALLVPAFRSRHAS